MLLNGRKVYVGRFMSRRERMEMLGDKARKFTNVYVRNFGDQWTDDKLNDVFTPFGKIISAKVMTDETGKSKGFGFISFEEHESAQKVSIVNS